MLFIPIPHCSMLVLKYSYEGQICVNTLYYFDATDQAQLHYTDFTVPVMSAWESTIQQAQTNQISMIGLKWTDMSTETGPTLEESDTPIPVGADTSPGLPGNCASVVTFRTPYRGRSARGRIYIPGVPQTAHSNGLLTGTYLAKLADFGDSWNVLQGQTVALYHVVASRYHDGVARAEGKTYLVDTYTVNPTVCSQRKRLPGRGT